MDLDYGKLGFKCGIEIHQQLDTHKLFCPCPSLMRDERPDVIVERRMRAVAGELGDVDPAALHEFLRSNCGFGKILKATNCTAQLRLMKSSLEHFQSCADTVSNRLADLVLL